ncbi:uncharacterized protein [Dysidea avara]|uniref:uncharacterized protein n=1 Tax=Dysidea avara TaxID=196820 RepID=UPI00332788B4
MKTQLLLTVGVIYSLTASLALRSEAVTKKTNCTVVGSTAKQEIQKFYCTVVKLYDEILMIKLDAVKPVLSDRDFNKHSVGIMLEQFTATCKIHTRVMMYKYQLEQYIPMEDSDDHLYTITTSLQETANLLEIIEEATSGLACVEFTPEQYQMIYTLLHDGQPLLTSLIQQVKKWTQAEDYCSNYGYPVPHNENCI